MTPGESADQPQKDGRIELRKAIRNRHIRHICFKSYMAISAIENIEDQTDVIEAQLDR